MIRRSGLCLGLALALALGSLSVALAPRLVSVSVDANSGPAPTCRYTDILAMYRTTAGWYRALLDTVYKLPSSYRPYLVPTSRAGISGGGYVRSFVIPNLTAMAAAAKAAGAPIRVRSAFRSYATQVSTFNAWVAKVGYAAARRVAARPGHSEHQLGTTIDFGSAFGAAPWVYFDWATSKAGAWMKAHAWEYGFVMSYPKGQSANSCYSYEPWHYRYFGRLRAKQIHDSGLVPRIWLWRTSDY